MATATLTVISISVLWVFTEVSKSKQKIAEIKKSYLLDQRKLIKNEVKQVVSMINFIRDNNKAKSEKQLQDEILNYYSHARLNYGGYVFINNYNGQALIFDGIKIIGKKSIKGLTDPDGLNIFNTEINAIQNNDGGFIKYKFKKLNDTVPTLKISFVYGYQDWKWIIGSGIYLDSLSVIIQQKRNEYLSALFKKILYISLVFVFLVLVIFVIAKALSDFVKSEFEVFMSFLDHKIYRTSAIDEKKLHIEEFKQMAQSANIVIEKQRNTEKLLVIERNKARRYLDVAEVIILALDVVGNVTLINKKGWETLGYKLADILGKNWFSYFIPLADKKVLSNNFLNVMSKNGKIDFRNRVSKIITAHGTVRIISWHNTLLYDNGKIIGSLSSGIDITEKRLAEESLSESDEKYRLLFEKTNDPVLIIGVNSTFIDCNRAALKILGLKNKKEIVGKYPDKISPINQPDGSLSIIKAAEMMAKARRKGFNRFEWLHQDINKKLFYVDVSLTAIPITGNEYLYVVWRDITARKKKDEELIIAKEKAEQSDKLKASFLEDIQHEIRTPLNGLMGFAQLLRNKNVNIDDAKIYADYIISSGEQLTKLINEILDFSKLQSDSAEFHFENIEIKQLLITSFKEYAHIAIAKNIEFTINICTENTSAIVKTEVARVKQIFGNLIDNAFKFTEDGKVELGCSVRNNEIIFYVSDTGVGIDSKHFNSIFEKFIRIPNTNQNKLYSGSGIGLSISKVILKYLNGNIWVESELTKGSKFIFSIPYKPVIIDSMLQNQVLSRCNITVVTNNIENLHLISDALSITGANITHINNGIDAIEACQNNIKTNLLVIDVNIQGMSGISTTKAIKVFMDNLPIVALCSDINNNTTKELALVAGADSYITTTDSAEYIKLTLSTILNTKLLNNNSD